MADLLLVDQSPLLASRLRRAARRARLALTTSRARSAAEARAIWPARLSEVAVVAVRVTAGRVEEDLSAIAELAGLVREAGLVALVPAGAPALARRCREAGADCCLSLPARPTRLLHQLVEVAADRAAPVRQEHLQQLIAVVEQAQEADGFLAVARIVVQAAASLGFARARLWLLSDDKLWILGACQHGDPALASFDQHRLRVADSAYTQLAMRSREPLFFRGQELGPWLLVEQFAAEGFVPPAGQWVHMPLWVGQDCWGMLSLDNAQAEVPIVGSQRALLRVFARQVAAALERAYLHEHEERQQREHAWLAAINAIAAETQRAESVQAVADSIVGAGARIGFERARLWLLDEAGVLAYGISQVGNSGLAGFSGFAVEVECSPYMREVIATRKPQIFAGNALGTGSLARAFGASGFTPPAGLWAALPLVAGDHVRGLLMLDRGERVAELDAQQLSLLDLLASQAAAALERARKSLERDCLEALAVLLQRTQQAQTPVEAAAMVVEACEAFGFERARLWGYDSAAPALVGLAQAGSPGIADSFPGMRAPLAETAYGRLIPAAREPVFFAAAAWRETYLARSFAENAFPPAVGEWALIPLFWEARFVGVLNLDNISRPRWIFPGQRDLLGLLGREVAATLERVRLLEEERRQRTARSWLEALARLSEAVQRALTPDSVVRAIVRGASELGFARARLWLLSDDRSVLRCIDQEGEPASTGLVGFELEMAEAVYVRHLSHGPDPMIFPSRSTAMARLDAALAERGFTPPAGEWASLPLWSGEAPIGLLVLDRGADTRPLDPDHPALLKLLGREASAALERVRLLAEERRHNEARDWLNELVAITTDPQNLPSVEAVAEVIVRGARRLGFERARLWRREGDSIVGVAQAGNDGLSSFPGTRIALAELPYSRETLDAGRFKIFTGRDRRSGLDQRFAAEGFQPPTGEWAELPLMTESGCWGLLTLDRIRSTRRLTAEDQELIGLFGSQAGAALQRARDRRRLASREQELRTLGELMEWVLQVNPAPHAEHAVEPLEQDFARKLLAAVARLIGRADTSAGLLLSKGGVPERRDRGQGWERYRYYWMEHEALAFADREQDLARGITSLALREGRTQHVADITMDERGEAFVKGQGRDTRSELDVPIMGEGGHILGVINLESPQVAAFDASHQSMMERLARVAALALGNLQRQRLLHATLAAVTELAAATSRDQLKEAICAAIDQLSPDAPALLIWDRSADGAPRPLVMRNVIRGKRRMDRNDRSAQVARAVMEAQTGLWLTDEAQLDNGDLEWLWRSQGLRAAVALPLVVANEQRCGALLIGYREPRDFTLEERTLFPIVAAAIAANLRDLGRLDELAAEGGRLKAALQIAGAVGISQHQSAIFEAILGSVSQIYPDTDIFLRIYDEQSGRLVLVPECRPYYHITDPERESPEGIAISNGVSLGAALARSFERSEQQKTEALNVPDVSVSNDYLPLVARTKSQLTAVIASGTVLLGVIGIESPRLNAFSDDDGRAIEEISRQISQAISRARLDTRLRRTLLVSARTTWAALLAHDINSEIAAIRHRLFLARHLARLGPEVDRHLEAIDRHADKLAGTMEFVQQDGDQGAARFALNAWLEREIPAMLASDAYDFDFSHQCSEVEVELHAFLLRTALLLLVRNAREAMGERGRLTVRTRSLQRTVELELEDSGPGVPEHIRRRLFEETHTSRGDGRGLGLLFVRMLVEDMGGSVQLLPTMPDRGAVFVLRLPIKSHPGGA